MEPEVRDLQQRGVGPDGRDPLALQVRRHDVCAPVDLPVQEWISDRNRDLVPERGAVLRVAV